MLQKVTDKISARAFTVAVDQQQSFAGGGHAGFQRGLAPLFLPHAAQMKLLRIFAYEFPDPGSTETAQYTQKAQRFQQIAFAAAIAADQQVFPLKKPVRPLK